MEQSKLNQYIGRAKKISNIAGWLKLQDEMRVAGATKAEMLEVSRNLQRAGFGTAVTSPVAPCSVPNPIGSVFIFSYEIVGDGGVTFDCTTNTVCIGKDLWNG